jgi:hypothetical protein
LSNDTTAPRTIFIIRHGEKPPAPNPSSTAPTIGIDVDGNPDSSSLTPLGWQRAGALATLFSPYGGQLRAGILTPTELFSPSYPKGAPGHRTHDTIFPLSQLLPGVTFDDTTYAEGDEKWLAKAVAAQTTGVTLICWEHSHIPTIANHIVGKANESEIPQTWPGDRFDVIWAFTSSSGGYSFTQLPQMLLFGDSTSVIPVGGTSPSAPSASSTSLAAGDAPAGSAAAAKPAGGSWIPISPAKRRRR